MKSGIIHWILLALGMSASLLAAELNPEMLEKLDFFLDYGIAENLEFLEGAELPPLETAKASGTIAGLAVHSSSRTVHISSQTLQISSAAINGGVK